MTEILDNFIPNSLASGPTLHLRVPSDARFARVVRERVITFAKDRHLDEPGLRDFITAIGEALADAIEHASSEAIEVNCWLDAEDHIIATVSDFGRGFAAVPNGPLLPPPSEERGRGLPIMRRYSDVFSLSSEPGKGTRVLLARKLHPVVE
jgi:anti-sigma regulatory factor (Ser/Thr protein kinase)